MRIGVPREIKAQEYRVGLTPESVRELTEEGHEVLVEHDAGGGIGATDDHFASVGARIVRTASEVFSEAELIVKVKEPLAPERKRLKRGQTLFTYLHLAADEPQMRDLVASGATAIAYETVTDADGGLPLLAPMSIVAGRMAIQVAAHFLERPSGGRGVLMAGAPGVAPARVVILGVGSAGSSAARIAAGMGATVVLVDRSAERLRKLALMLGGDTEAVLATPQAIEHALTSADVVVGAALVPGASAPKLVSRRMLAGMRRGAVMVDISIDQGGCFETSRPTTHADPVFEVDGVLHYCVANMPGAVPHTSTYALNHATLPYVKRLASLGIAPALANDAGLREGLAVCAGAVTRKDLAAMYGYACTDPLKALAAAGG